MEEESTNGKLEAIKIGEQNGMIYNGAEKIESNDSSSSSSSSSDDESIDSPSLKKIAVNLEELEDENEGFESEVKSVEPRVTLFEVLIPDEEIVVANEETKETSPCLDENIEHAPTIVEVVSEETVNIEDLSDTVDTELGLHDNIQFSSDLQSGENFDTKLELNEKIETSSREADVESEENGLKKPEETETILDQPAVSLAPFIPQKTSWLGCCGLADFLGRSDR